MVARVRAKKCAPSSRGFTLTELMVVVAMVGILATVGVASFRKELSASKVSEATSVVQALRGGQEAYRAENQRYLDVSGTENRWYPTSDFDKSKWNFQNPSHADYALWRRLGAVVNQPVLFRYLVHAGDPGSVPKAVTVGTGGWKPTEPWYLIEARADADEDETYCDVVATSATLDLIVNHEGE